MSTTDQLATLRTSITHAFSSLFSFSFRFAFAGNDSLKLQEPAVPKTPPPQWWQQMTYMPEPDVDPSMSPSPVQNQTTRPRMPADLRKYTPEGARFTEEMDLFEDVFRAPTVPHSQKMPKPAFQLGCPPPAPDSWREFIASKKAPPPLSIQKVAAQKRQRAEAPVRNKRGRGNRRGENGEPARKKARLHRELYLLEEVGQPSMDKVEHAAITDEVVAEQFALI
ncbi:hypothetical protein AC579_9126 [Pseudocercospora musae]|uniref:Uncharacterized protein n=1 Tax=Pseudocercospora musae TaxID=113226 RepID=A0A139IIF2_9PEZI|nr:hypothetical protein AC579_9126 [Pseudocercospora musae]